ncbi:hypothetical protein RCG23_10210 [Neobacillus sp. PS3-34]|uniref:hypothetical protein n=1 Tax=Neobacillus sp. PS3-34 TaxID=3070678 RepID=UPI0027E07600|nr:hypothetical protein [Neobacillus sp. PS3-34]WML50158.1 hypothetical protein RCG23_10210 [Neobacillus sp. PS3-34]
MKNREYESLQFRIIDDSEGYPSSMEMKSEGVFVDKNGIKYDMKKYLVSYAKIEQPRYFFTVLSMTLHSNKAGEKVIPKKLEIFGYNTTKYLDNVVKISLK